MMVTLPSVLRLLDASPPRRSFTRRTVVGKVPLFALSAIGCVVAFPERRNGGAMQTRVGFPLGLYLENALITAVIYIDKTFWPALALVSALVRRCFRSRPYLAVGGFWCPRIPIPVIEMVQAGLRARAALGIRPDPLVQKRLVQKRIETMKARARDEARQ